MAANAAEVQANALIQEVANAQKPEDLQELYYRMVSIMLAQAEQTMGAIQHAIAAVAKTVEEKEEAGEEWMFSAADVGDALALATEVRKAFFVLLARERQAFEAAGNALKELDGEESQVEVAKPKLIVPGRD